MNKKDAEKKAQHISQSNGTVAVVYSYLDDKLKLNYDACLEEHFSGDEEDIELMFASGVPLLFD